MPKLNQIKAQQGIGIKEQIEETSENVKKSINPELDRYIHNYLYDEVKGYEYQSKVKSNLKTINYYIPGNFGGEHDANWMFNEDDGVVMNRVYDLNEEVDIVIFTGGSDINPAIYKHKKHYSTYCNAYRDEVEVDAIEEAIKLGIPIFGICRGFQLLSAMAGATLIQDVTNHSGHHNCQILTNNHPDLPTTYNVNSIHHQMVNPFDMNPEDYELIGVCNPVRSNHYLNGANENVNMPMEPEIAFFPKIKAYGAQFHPEMLGYNHPVCKFLREDIKLKLNIKI